MKSTAVIGASPDPTRYSHMAVLSLLHHGHPVRAIGTRQGRIGNVDIETDRPAIRDIDTMTVYVGPAHLSGWEDYILSLQPKRIIFNPGAENQAFRTRAEAAGISCEEACTLVLLATESY